MLLPDRLRPRPRERFTAAYHAPDRDRRRLAWSRASGGRVVLVAALFAGAWACDRGSSKANVVGTSRAASVSPSAAGSASASALPMASAASSGSPLSRLVPRPRTGPRPLCPLAIEPGVGLGPVLLGERVSDLEHAGVKVVRDDRQHDTRASITLPAAPGGVATRLHLDLCEGKIVSVTLDDLRQGPGCVTYAGKPVARTVARADLEAALGGCQDATHGTGSSTESCDGGGVYLSYNMGQALQLRVMPRGFEPDNTCAFAIDDGSLVTLPDGVRTRLFEQMLMSRFISSYWHIDRPGRDPLRVVKTPLVPAVEMTMFGSPVIWIDASEAKPGTAFLTVTKLEASATRATLAFTYPVEGVAGAITYRRSRPGEEWQIERGEVHEQK